MNYTVYELTALFFIYAFLGWVSEVIFAACKTGKFVNRGFLLGPICPIYGFGVLTVLSLLEPVKGIPPLAFVLSVIITSALELLTGAVLQAVFHERFWDYSDEKFNIGGYICLSFSLVWGFACMAVLYIVHPMIFAILKKIPHVVGIPVLCVLLATVLTDATLTVFHALKLDKRMRAIDEMSEKLENLSCHLGEGISEKALVIKAKTETNAQQFREKAEIGAAQLKERAEQLKLDRENLKLMKEKYHKLTSGRNIIHEHLFNSFSHLSEGKYKKAYEKMRRERNPKKSGKE